MDFRKYINDKLFKQSDRILEFGPLTRPIASKEKYPNIYFADIKSTDDIKKLYASNEYLKSTGLSVELDSIIDVDYVVRDSYRETFKDIEKFDVVVLSHVIEHMPDIIYFFQDVLNILKKDGKLVIIYPDARYCFDHFRNGTSFIEAYDVYNNKKPNRNAVFDFTYNVVHENNPIFFWNDLKIVSKLPKNKFTDAVSAYKKAGSNEMPEDVHFWPFSDYQFIKFLYDMERAGLLGFEICDFYETQNNTQEFLVVLSRKKLGRVDYGRYEDILGRISPATKNAITAKEKADLNDKVTVLEDTKKGLKIELETIYNSRRWKLLKKVADMKKKIFK